MATTIVEDVVEGSGLEWTSDGLYYVRAMKIRGIPREPASSFLWRACQPSILASPADAAKLPEIGKQHPTIPSMICESFRVDPIPKNRDDANCKMYYRNSLWWTVRVNGVLQRENTRFGIDGTLLGVNHIDNKPDEYVPKKDEANSIWDSAVAPRMIPGSLLEFEVIRSVGAWGTVFDQQKQFQGKLNSAKFQGEDAHLWACTNLAGRPLGLLGQAAYWVYNYQFQHCGFAREFGGKTLQDSYDPVLIWTFRNTDKPPNINPYSGGFPGSTQGNGWKQVRIDGEADFNKLEIPAVFNGKKL